MLTAKNSDLSQTQTVAVLASGVIGGLAYTFSDTFWFSAVEAEVYASSSLFTAIVFWAILKWEDSADQKYANRWLILIAYMMGLSIGVHLLNLLTIPALVFVYYFKKYEVNKKGIIFSFLTAVAILGFIMYGIIPGAVNLASKFELMFVNGFGMPFNSGLFVYLFLLAGGLAFGIYYTHKKAKVLLNTIILGVTVILIGYSSFTIIVIRSIAETPMNENQPDNVFALLSYLNREQYGDRPLMFGNQFNSQYEYDREGNVISEKNYTYIKEGDKYKKIEKTNPSYSYDPKYVTFFPRMYSKSKDHISAYLSWTGTTKSDFLNAKTDNEGNILRDNSGEIVYNYNSPKRMPSLGENLKFFFKYQVGHMYFRYFMWNFAGRQNDSQSYGGTLKGNWISGIPFIDSITAGPQNNLPDKVKNEKSRNKYYFLPLLLGLLGLMFSLTRNEKIFTVIGLLFFFTGIAIVMYLNQTPFQPRERDYAYAGSFYAFAIWIGLGVLALYETLRTKTAAKNAVIIAFAVTIPVPTVLAVQNWDDHDRSGRYTARDFAKNYLNSCEKNAILFTYGDNDTFPLWYVQETEEFRTDVKVVNLSLLGTDWYINQMRRQAYDSKPIPFKMDRKAYRQGTRDAIYMLEDQSKFIEEKYNANSEKFIGMYNHLYDNLITVLESSKYPETQKKEFEKLKSKTQKLSIVQLISIIKKISEPVVIAQLELDKDFTDKLVRSSGDFLEKVASSYLPLDVAMDFVASDKKTTKLRPDTPDEMDYIPSKSLCIKVDKKNVLASGKFTDEEIKKFEPYVRWKLSKRYLMKNDMAVLEILARNNWERPVYFATSVGSDNYMGLTKYFRLEGFAYRLIPYKNTTAEVGAINTDVLYENVMTKFSWGRMNQDDVLIENYNRRVMSVMDIKETFSLLAKSLMLEDKKEKAEEVLDRCVELMPDKKVPFDYNMISIIEGYYKLEKFDKANAILETTCKNYGQSLKYYRGFSKTEIVSVLRERGIAETVINQLSKIAEAYDQNELAERMRIYLM